MIIRPSGLIILFVKTVLIYCFCSVFCFFLHKCGYYVFLGICFSCILKYIGLKLFTLSYFFNVCSSYSDDLLIFPDIGHLWLLFLVFPIFTRGLSILLDFSETQPLILFILSVLYWFSISSISGCIFLIFFFPLSFFPKFLKWMLKSFNFFLFLS